MLQQPQSVSSNTVSSQNHAALPFRDVVFGAIVLLFVLYGAYDICSRIFGKAPQTEDTSAFLAQEATTSRPMQAVPFVPEHLAIDKLSVSAGVEQAGLKPDGNMRAPSNFQVTAWYAGGSKPGEAGNTVIAGHLNNALDTSGVFEHLNDLNLGDTITVTGEGHDATYVVRQMTVYAADLAPKAEIFTTSGPSRLVLITCNGAWDKGKRTYDKRLVVYADLLSAH